MQYKCVSISNLDGVTGKSSVGITKTGEGYEIITPYGLLFPEDINRTDIENFRILKKYAHCIRKALKKDRVKAHLEIQSIKGANPMAAMHILIDFIENGIYREYESIYTYGAKGKINFKRTIKKCTPQIQGENVYYTNFIVKNKKINEEEIVAIAQVSVINHFMQYGGELLFGNRVTIPKAKIIPLSKALISKLKPILASSFNSRKQQLITWIIQYIEGAVVNKEIHGEWQYMIIASTLWEEMVDFCYTNQRIRDKTKYGRRYYVVRNGKKQPITLPTQHDTIYEDSEQVVILDAKMYESINILYTTEVLQKQFGYYGEARQKNPTKHISNVLVMPYVDDGISIPGFQEDVIPNTEEFRRADRDTENVIIVYKAKFTQLLDAYFYNKKLYESFIAELYQHQHSTNYINNIDKCFR